MTPFINNSSESTDVHMAFHPAISTNQHGQLKSDIRQFILHSLTFYTTHPYAHFLASSAIPPCTQSLVCFAIFSRSSSDKFLRSAALASGTAKPRWTAGRDLTFSSQALTLGNLSKETPAQSTRQR